MPKKKTLLVGDVMTRDVTVVSQRADVHELEKLFLEKKIHGAPVTDDSGRLVGVVSQTDLLAWHHETGVDGCGFYERPALDVADADQAGQLPLTDVRSSPVGEIMTPVTYHVREADTASHAAECMLEYGVHRLVVLDDDLGVRGIVSAMDLLRLVTTC